MLDMTDMLHSIIQTAERANPQEPDDYFDNEGFLMCGICHTRRECLIDLPDIIAPGERRQQKVRVLCSCRAKRAEEEEAERKRQEELRAIASLRAQSLMDERLSDARFDTVIINDSNRRNMKLCKSYAERFDEMLEKNQGLLMHGAVGTGKTYAAACIANYLMDRRRPVVMTSFIKLLETMSGFGRGDDKVIEKLNRAKLLIIDDLGAERDTEFAIEKVYDIIDSRYRAGLPLILTTNLSLDEMKRTTDIRYARIYDRIFELCYPMQFVGKSWRKAEASRRFMEMEKLLEVKDE